MHAAEFITDRLLRRNGHSASFFTREAPALARASAAVAERFARGGRLLAVGQGPYATDAQHVEVEFVHPVLVGKTALPALDLSGTCDRSLPLLLRAEDIVLVFGPPGGDPELGPLLEHATARGALTFGLPGTGSAFSLAPSDTDPFIHQELIEILYHTLWETVHVFLEHRQLGHDAGPAAFLYPFLGRESADPAPLLDQVAASIVAKAREVEELRAGVALEQAGAIERAALALRERLARGGRLLVFGNGGSATDANDFAIDCVASPKGAPPIPALSLAAAPAVLSALANDIGSDALFLRQLLAHGEPNDVAIAISTSGGSKNVIAALEAARKRGLLTVAVLGHDGGEVLRRAAAEHVLTVRSDYVPRIQEVQASICHVLLDLLAAYAAGEVTERSA